MSQAYLLSLDGPLFRRQRRLLEKLLAAAHKNTAELFVSEEEDNDLEGLVAMLDEIADQAHDRYGLDCLFQEAAEVAAAPRPDVQVPTQDRPVLTDPEAHIAKTVLTVEICYNPQFTDPEGLAVAMDRLLETVLSLPGILDEYTHPTLGEFFVADSAPKRNTAPPRVVLDISGGVLQDVFCDDPRAEIVLIDWDTDGCNPAENGIVDITDHNGNRQLAAVTEFPVLPFTALTETDTAAALEGAGLEKAVLSPVENFPCPRYLLYDFDRDDLAATRIYRDRSEAVADADQCDNVIVVPFSFS